MKKQIPQTAECDELKTLLLEGFQSQHSQLQPNVKYTVKMICKIFWEHLDNYQKRISGDIFKSLVLTGEIPMESLGESAASGHSQQYRLK